MHLTTLTTAIHGRIAQRILDLECARIAALAESDVIAAHQILRGHNGKIVNRIVRHVRHVLRERDILLRIDDGRHHLVVLECHLFVFVDVVDVVDVVFQVVASPNEFGLALAQPVRFPARNARRL